MFAWSMKKATSNSQKHRVSFDEAKTVFDEIFISFVD